ncbi:MAG TPA: A/G-specific adenine glycosylase [Actinomycetota bacterium]
MVRRSRRALLRWYEPRRDAYPWRKIRDPYRIWVSEIMLQQTQAPRVVAAYRAFLRKFPSLRSLAAAPRRDVVAAWGDLGYNRRAVALSEAARAVVREFGGRFPAEPSDLRRLPGVGPYTAAAVSSLAFGLPVAAVDTNVRRIVTRFFFGSEAHALTAGRIADAAQRWIAPDEPGAWTQALMDLGREICRPRPRCQDCPISQTCRFISAVAVPKPQRRRQPPFEGSARQVRGAVVRILRSRSRSTLHELARASGFPLERIVAAVATLRADGLVSAGPAALRGSPSGVARLAS